MGTTAETPDTTSGSPLRICDASISHCSGTQIAIHIFRVSAFTVHSLELLRPLLFAHNKGAVSPLLSHMADLETCHRSTVVESVSCNVTGLASFYSPHGTAEANTPRERQYDRNAEKIQERNQEFLQYPTDQSREMLHESFVDSHQPYSEPMMENTGGSAKREIAQDAATLVSVVADVPEQAGEGSTCRYRSKIVSGASCEVLRNSSVPPDHRRRASLNEPGLLLETKAYERVSPTRIFSVHHPSRGLQARSESAGQNSSRMLQQPFLQQEGISPSNPQTHSAANVSRCLHSNREWASEGQSCPHQGHATAPVAKFVEPNQTESTAIHGVRLRPSSPCKTSENSAATKDLVINALCDQIQHQQWKLRVQENRLHNQEQRLHDLEAFVSTFQAQQEWNQRQQQQHMCQLLSRPRGCHTLSSVEVVNDLASSSSGIPRVAANSSLIGTKTTAVAYDSISDILCNYRIAFVKLPRLCLFSA